MTALARRAREGGSYEIRVSLAQTGRWFDALGRTDEQADRDPGVEDIGDLTAPDGERLGRPRLRAPGRRALRDAAALDPPAPAPRRRRGGLGGVGELPHCA